MGWLRAAVLGANDGIVSVAAIIVGVAATLIGYPAAQECLGYVSNVHGGQVAGPPSTIYIRAATGHEASVQSLLAQTANPKLPTRQR